MAVTYAGLANGGVSCRPHLLAHVDSAGRTILTVPVERSVLPMARQDLDQVRLALRRAVEYGTATRAHLKEVTIAGKTGTAQNPPKPDHAWFIGYAPADTPEVVFAVLVENAGHGGAVAAPIASRLIRAWFFPDEAESVDRSDEQVQATRDTRTAPADTARHESGAAPETVR
jgi:cell division protein FtsI/penicillin-binding protein 2